MNQPQGQAGTNPAEVRSLIGQGFELLRQGRVEDAVELAERLAASHPRDPEVRYLGCEAQFAIGNAGKALGHIEAAIASAPGQPQLLLKKSGLLTSLRRRHDAREAAEAAASFAGNDGHALWEIGQCFGRNGDPARAVEYYQRALDAGIVNPRLLYDMASAQFYTGDFLAAEKNLDAHLERVPQNGYGYYLRATLRRQTEAENHVGQLQARLKEGFREASARAACQYALAKELEDLGRDEESFAALAEAAATKTRTLEYDAAADLNSISAIRSAYSAEVMQAPTAGHDEEGPIFIVGMPRTGTTLLERMLTRHGDVSTAGELLDFGQALTEAVERRIAEVPASNMVEASLGIDFAALGRDYLYGARQAAPGTRLFIDKLPVNYIYCGLIRKALPRAKIIHLVRDPMDTCYAVYKTLFSQAYFFSYDLDEIADYYANYRRQMRHWHEAMPGSILDVRYEDLVREPEAQARRLLEWCGLEWQASVLDPEANEAPAKTASAAQVREPIHTRSIGKWRRHESALAPLRARLAAAGVLED
jgi:tetratricopeptide (TPR) repeat protein